MLYVGRVLYVGCTMYCARVYTPAAQPVMTSVLPVLCCGPPSAPSPPAGVAPECVWGGGGRGGNENKLLDMASSRHRHMYVLTC